MASGLNNNAVRRSRDHLIIGRRLPRKPKLTPTARSRNDVRSNFGPARGNFFCVAGASTRSADQASRRLQPARAAWSAAGDDTARGAAGKVGTASLQRRRRRAMTEMRIRSLCANSADGCARTDRRDSWPVCPHLYHRSRCRKRRRGCAGRPAAMKLKLANAKPLVWSAFVSGPGLVA